MGGFISNIVLDQVYTVPADPLKVESWTSKGNEIGQFGQLASIMGNTTAHISTLLIDSGTL